jgi:phosphonoacetaldehyde hydrolase
VIFDMAGTVLDFGSIAPAGVFIEVFKRRQVEISVTEARGPMGAEKRRHIEMLLEMPQVAERFEQAHGRHWTQDDVDALYADFIPLQVESLPKFSDLIPGAGDIAKTLKKRGIRIGVNSGYNREMLEVCLEAVRRQGFEPESAVAASDVPRARPSPAMSLKNVIELGVENVAGCIKVDDTVPGIDEGLNAGMWTIGLSISGNEVGLNHETWSGLSADEKATARTRAEDKMRRAGAHYVVDSIADILPCVDDIEARLRKGERP